MYIMPQYDECLDENGKFSEEKFNKIYREILKMVEANTMSEIEITPEMEEKAKKQLWRNYKVGH